MGNKLMECATKADLAEASAKAAKPVDPKLLVTRGESKKNIDNLRQELEACRIECSTTHTQMQRDLQSHMEDISAELEELRRAFENKANLDIIVASVKTSLEKKIGTAQGDIDTLRQEFNAFRAKPSTDSAGSSAMGGKFQSLSSRLDDMGNKLMECATKADLAEASAKAAKPVDPKLLVTRGESKKNIDNLRQELEACRIECSTTHTQMQRDLQSHMEDISAELEELRRAFENKANLDIIVASVKTSLEKKIGTAQRDIDTLRQDLATSRAETSRLIHLSDSKFALKSHMDDMDAKLEAKAAQINASFDEHLKSVRVDVGKVEASMNKAAQISASFNEQLKSVRVDVGKVEASMNEAAQINASFTEQLKSVKVDVGRVEASMKEAAQINSSFTDQLESAKAEVGKLEAFVKEEVVAIRTKTSVEVANARKIAGNLHTHVESVEGRLKTIESEFETKAHAAKLVEASRSACKELFATKADTNEQIGSMLKDIERCREDSCAGMAELRDANDVFRRYIRDASGKFEGLKRDLEAKVAEDFRKELFGHIETQFSEVQTGIKDVSGNLSAQKQRIDKLVSRTRYWTETLEDHDGRIDKLEASRIDGQDVQHRADTQEKEAVDVSEACPPDEEASAAAELMSPPSQPAAEPEPMAGSGTRPTAAEASARAGAWAASPDGAATNAEAEQSPSRAPPPRAAGPAPAGRRRRDGTAAAGDAAPRSRRDGEFVFEHPEDPEVRAITTDIELELISNMGLSPMEKRSLLRQQYLKCHPDKGVATSSAAMIWYKQWLKENETWYFGANGRTAP